MNEHSRRPITTMGMLIAAISGMGLSGFSAPSTAARAPRRHVPRMVTASPEEIAAWNKKVAARSDRGARIANRRRDRRLAKALNGNGQHPKFLKDRVHKQHKHALRDDHGVVCLIGKPYELDGVHPTSREVVLEGWVDGEQFGYTVQRKWLAGIYAQRGY